MELFYYPLSRYSQKVLIALYEKQANFYPRVIDIHDPFSRQQFKASYPTGKLPLLKTRAGELLPESSIIIEYIDNEFSTGTQLIPTHPSQALDVRLFDRIIDNDLSNQLFKLEKLQARQLDDPLQVKHLENEINQTLHQLNNKLTDNHWLCGDSFTLADCALIPCIMQMRRRFKLYEFDALDRYLHQAELRGAWIQVEEEIALAGNAISSGFRPIP
ncbi:glutathione S-transferase family protein [Shewanella colwelliana]|uniref:Glutathione S-transferase n=1 Tax=Shewanella colwelliana TaxID=23 RepID=A0A1E5IV96_SHECO|nr:glutathione S-transferase family protein [Shewanella colwelliana]OEG73998.1 glutathione S-transferase [Shewanella colwelliana]GIU39209.1 glutathione S-transferase [Shewanella colwelliana]